jgi:hypothetical protein
MIYLGPNLDSALHSVYIVKEEKACRPPRWELLLIFKGAVRMSYKPTIAEELGQICESCGKSCAVAFDIELLSFRGTEGKTMSVCEDCELNHYHASLHRQY